jgi:carboxymethylenebutenolidase
MWNSFSTDARAGITAQVISYPGGGLDEIHAWLARPDGDGPAPGIVAVHHLPGWDEFYREFCERLACHGHIVICPDLYCRFGHGSPDDVAAMVRSRGGVRDGSVVADCAAALSWLKALPASNGRAGVIGTCSGGRHALLAASLVPGFDAVADLWGGGVVLAQEELSEARPAAPIDYTAQLTVPLLGLFGNDYTHPSPEQVNQHEAELKRHGKMCEFCRYDCAKHGFSTTTPRCTGPRQRWTAGRRSSASSAATWRADRWGRRDDVPRPPGFPGGGAPASTIRLVLTARNQSEPPLRAGLERGLDPVPDVQFPEYLLDVRPGGVLTRTCLGTPMIPMTVCPAGQRGITQPEGRFLPPAGRTGPARKPSGSARVSPVRDTSHVDGADGAASHLHTTGIFGQCVHAGMEPDDRSWQLAISFIAAWRGTGAGRDPSACAHRLAEPTADGDGDGTTIEQAVLGLTALGNMFLELYADCAGSSADAVLREASSINWDKPR